MNGQVLFRRLHGLDGSGLHDDEPGTGTSCAMVEMEVGDHALLPRLPDDQRRHRNPIRDSERPKGKRFGENTLLHHFDSVAASAESVAIILRYSILPRRAALQNPRGELARAAASRYVPFTGKT